MTEDTLDNESLDKTLDEAKALLDTPLDKKEEVKTDTVEKWDNAHMMDSSPYEELTEEEKYDA